MLFVNEKAIKKTLLSIDKRFWHRFITISYIAAVSSL